jgi:hypothetical protein
MGVVSARAIKSQKKKKKCSFLITSPKKVCRAIIERTKTFNHTSRARCGFIERSQCESREEKKKPKKNHTFNDLVSHAYHRSAGIVRHYNMMHEEPFTR